ncbi:Antitoxin [Alteromonas sp. 38]|uniref:type II RES/Xre toxin-antitoxin system antitoxin n=1 Tax=unclassified Alteromonas TaxID=2614992 RepID=UPI0012F0B423|nr:MULTISPECIES: antitoxin Xre-like helix-turn-helix domain-containing protein [unclassified Alteromonas]CAD5255557.1 Antitoxin [Alteromonas sp. 154]VXA98355.1 Antitoxin [Alteromonas sp. 38]
MGHHFRSPRGSRLQEAIARGLPYSIYLRVASYAEITNAEFVGVLGISVSTLSRRANTGRLSVGESEKVVRLIQMINAGIILFDGNKDKALSWLKSPSRGLNGIQPITMISTYAGSNEVLELIGRLENGVFW